MITLKNEALKDAVKKNESKPTRLALLAGSSPDVLKKLLSDKTDFTITSAHQIADYLDLDVIVEFVPRQQVFSKSEL